MILDKIKVFDDCDGFDDDVDDSESDYDWD